MRLLPSRKVPTPFGSINLPDMDTPILAPPQVDERRRTAVRHAVAQDLTGVLGLIPYVGSLVGGQIADLHFAEMRKILTPPEMSRYVESDKRIPSNGLALLYSFVRS